MAKENERFFLPSTPGVYCLWNKITNQIYVGSAKDLSKRIPRHFSPKCHNVYLKRSIQKYGKENFSISWVETGDDFIEEEQRLLNYVFTLPSKQVFNVAIKAGGGKVLSDYSSQRRLSEAGGGFKSVPLFLICTKTKVLNQIESSYEGERLGFGLQCHLSHYSKPNCLKRVKTCLVARSESEAKLKLEAWFQILGNTTINNPIVLTLGKSDFQSALCKLANVRQNNFSKMYNEVIRPSTGKPRYFSMQSKADFNWHGTEVKTGDWFRCIRTNLKQY